MTSRPKALGPMLIQELPGASFVAHIEKDVWNWELMGTKGGGRWDPPMTFRDVAGTMVNSTPGFLPPYGDFPSLFHIKLQNWVDCAMKGTEQVAPAEAGACGAEDARRRLPLRRSRRQGSRDQVNVGKFSPLQPDQS